MVVGAAGDKSHEVGFNIKSSNGSTVCNRNPGYDFMDNIIFCTFCPNCSSSLYGPYEVRLYDQGSNGWEGTVLAFRQDGKLIKIGSTFTSGDKKGPSAMNLKKGMTTDIVVYTLGANSDEVKY